MLRTALFSGVLVSLVAITTAHAQTAEQSQKLISELALPSNSKITYLDSNGKAIDYNEFMRQVRQPGHSFATTKDFDSHTATLRINPDNASAPAIAPLLKIKPGDELPAFSLRDTQGRHLTNASLTGHYTLLTFYFADCPPCIAEVPSLNALEKQHKDFELLGATFETRAAAVAFGKQRGLKVPSLTDAKQWINRLGVSTYPTLLLIDPHGRMVAGVLSTTLVKATDKAAAPSAAEIVQWVEKHRAPTAH